MRIIAATLISLAIITPSLAQVKKVPDNHGEVTLSYSKVVKDVSPSVVNIYASRKVSGRQSMFRNDDFFSFFFNQRNFRAPPRVEKSLGSGVIVSDEGFIVTNYHVIEGKDKISVVLKDMREFDASVVLNDKKSDISVLKIETGAKLPSLSFANSDLVEVGDLSLAVGNPFGIGQTVTSGIVSAIGRSSHGISDYQFFIQTDAAINPGNSGGALVNSLGHLIGINTAIYSKSGGSNGIGFAIPANRVEKIVNSAISGKDLVRPWSGIKIQTLDRDLAESLGLKQTQGVMVQEISKVSPFFKSGLRRGDVILDLNGKAIPTAESFNYEISNIDVGVDVTANVTSFDGRKKIVATMIAPPKLPAEDLVKVSSRMPLQGASIVNISPYIADRLEISDLYEGVVIKEVARRSLAERYGFKVGDVILSLSDYEILNTDHIREVTNFKMRLWRISILRNGRIINSVLGG